MTNENDTSVADLLANDDAWLAAEVRQIFRARRAGDNKALKVAWFYFEDFLFKTLQWHIRKKHPEWDGRFRFFDGMNAEPEYPSPGRITVRGEVAWVHKTWYYDPFDFEIEICPRSGELVKYVFRFGDHRPLSAKVSGSALAGIPVGGWVYEIHHEAGNT